MSKSELLFRAIRKKKVQKVKELVNENPELVNEMEANTIFPIHVAAIEGNEEIVNILLDSKADIEAIYKDRNATPLDCAIVYGRKNIIQALVSRGANLNGRLQTAIKGSSGEFEEFKELPSRNKYAEIVELLRELGAKENDDFEVD